MGLVRTSDKTPFEGTKRVLIQFDTLCKTGCSYCFLASRVSNPITYNPDRLMGFIKEYSPEALTLYGADTFINKELYGILLNKLVTTPSIKYMYNVSELFKLKRDSDFISEIYITCAKNNIRYISTFSMDLVGPKKYFNFDNLITLSNKVLRYDYMLNILISKEIITEVYENIDNIVNEINLNYSRVKHMLDIKIRFAFDFASTDLPIPGIEIKLRKILEAFDKCEINNVINGDETFTTFGCEARDAEGMFIDLNGNIKSCGRLLVDYDIPEKISALDFKKTDLENLNKQLFTFKQYNNDVIMDKCKTCKARYICAPCPKNIYAAYGENFKEDILMCQFFKTYYDFLKEK